MNIGMELVPTQQMSERQLLSVWRDAPFSAVQRAQVLENAQRTNGKSLERHYTKVTRPRILAPDSKRVALVHIGPSGSGKTTAAEHLLELLEQDKYLETKLRQQNRSLEITTLPLVQAVSVAQMEIFDEQGEVVQHDSESTKGLRRLIDSAKSMGMFTEDEYRKVSKFMWDQLEKHFFQPDRPDKVKVLIVEAQAITAIPCRRLDGSFDIQGFDRGMSVITQLLTDIRTANNTEIYAYLRDEQVLDQAVKTRLRLLDTPEDPDNFKYNSNANQAVVTARREDGTIVLVSELPIEEQVALATILKRCSNSPEGIKRADEQIEMVLQGLREQKRKGKNVDDLYTELKKELRLSRDQFILVKNPFLLGPRNFDMKYLIRYSLFAQHYPALLDPTL